MARQHLQADRQPVDRPAGMVTAGLPLRFEGAVSAALFMMARTNPISWMRSRARASSRVAGPPP